jgi:hypothetical protein
MSEGIAHGGYAPRPSSSQPAYGVGRLAYEPPPKAEEHLDGSSHAALVVAIFAPVVAFYGALTYGLYRVSDAIF